MRDWVPTNDPLFETLTQTVRTGRCIAVIGAGMSSPDYPLWEPLVSSICSTCGVRPEDSRSNDFLDLAEAARVKDEGKYRQTLIATFARKVNPVSAYRYHLLARIHFASYVTSNVDPLLVDVLSLHRNITLTAYPHLYDWRHGKREIYHLHGRVDPERPMAMPEIVLARSDFDHAYNPSETLLHSFLQHMFVNHDVCFLGFNPAEQNLRRILQPCRALVSQGFGLNVPNPPRWYLLLDEISSPATGLAESGIQLVKYPRTNAAFLGLDKVLEHWAEKRDPFVRMPGMQQPFDPAPEPEQ